MEYFYELMKPIFRAIQYPILPFTYNEKTQEYVSEDSFMVDCIPYMILVKSDGIVLYGTTDGVQFYEEGFLGKIDLAKSQVS